MKAKSEDRTVAATLRPDLLRSSLRMRGRASVSVPAMLHGRATLVGAVVFFMALGLGVGWLLRTQWVAAAFAGPVLAAVSLWAVDVWVLETLPPGPFELILSIGAAEIGVALAVWDRTRMQPQPQL